MKPFLPFFEFQSTTKRTTCKMRQKLIKKKITIKVTNYIGKMIENNKKNKRLLLSQFSDTDVIGLR